MFFEDACTFIVHLHLAPRYEEKHSVPARPSCTNNARTRIRCTSKSDPDTSHSRRMTTYLGISLYFAHGGTLKYPKPSQQTGFNTNDSWLWVLSDDLRKHLVYETPICQNNPWVMEHPGQCYISWKPQEPLCVQLAFQIHKRNAKPHQKANHPKWHVDHTSNIFKHLQNIFNSNIWDIFRPQPFSTLVISA